MKSIFFLLLYACGLSSFADPVGRGETIEVRVGILAFQDFLEDFSRFDRLFSEFSKSSHGRFHFRMACGTYGELMHWMDQGWVDVAILSPGVFAGAPPASPQKAGPRGYEYMASMGLMSGEHGALNAYRHQYHSVCVVSDRSPIRTWEDIRRAAGEGQIQFLFVHPFSVSGRIAPEYALKQSGIVPTQDRVIYTSSHSQSLRTLSEESRGLERVAFVWEASLVGAKGVRTIDIPSLKELSIPSDVVVARSGFPHTARIQELLLAHVDRHGVRDFERFSDGDRRYDVILQWKASLGLSVADFGVQEVSFEEIGQLLLHHARSQPTLPRLALVLSGGGAKCSYQVGVIKAIEQELLALRTKYPRSGLDIGLVVGTSGGAMNALPVALGISSDAQGGEDFGKIWTELDQREMIRPSQSLRANIGLWWSCFHAFWVLCLVRLGFFKVEHRAAWVAFLLLMVAGVQFGVFHYRWPSWQVLGDHHAVHHLWLLGFLGLGWSGGYLLIAGAFLFIIQRWRVRRGRPLVLTTLWPHFFLILLMGTLPLVQGVTLFFCEKTLSDGTGIEETLATHYPRMINAKLGREKQPALTSTSGRSCSGSLQEISRQLFARKLFQRDLVLTGSCLKQTSVDLPNDLYFYVPSGSYPEMPHYGKRGVRLDEHSSLLMDVVLGSGSIFPIFPPRLLKEFPAPGERVELVDGGFSHNSPIEAAMLWGATHILLIQASPEERNEGGNFLQNSVEAFNHLYNQAQLVDAHTKGRVAIFTLAPKAPHLCVIDFADNLIRASMERGYFDARARSGDGGKGLVQKPCFHKELGEPIFWEVGDIRR